MPIAEHEIEGRKAEARNSGKNRWFTTNDRSRNKAMLEITHELGPVRRSMPPPAAEEFAGQMFTGLMAQLYNPPLDLLIEQRIATRHPALRSAQIEIIDLLLADAINGCTSPEVIRVVPRRILHASRFLNACYAAFVDQQFAGALAAAAPYNDLGTMDRGLKLFALWEQETRDFAPGQEYNLVDAFATELRLDGWFEWISDTGGPAPAPGPGGASNSALLAFKSPAAVFYFLEILKKFDGMSPEAIKQVATEAALVGREGLDYGNPEERYRVQAYGPEVFSGLEVLCLMFAAFQRIAPQDETGIDLHDAWPPVGLQFEHSSARRKLPPRTRFPARQAAQQRCALRKKRSNGIFSGPKCRFRSL